MSRKKSLKLPKDLDPHACIMSKDEDVYALRQYARYKHLPRNKLKICEAVEKSKEAGKRARKEAETEDIINSYIRKGGDADYSRENPRRSPRLAVLRRKKEEQKKKALSPRTKAKKGKKKKS